jgi:hypothetical protein
MTTSLFRMSKMTAHRWTALAVFAAAFLVYKITMAPSVSFWDVGEFVTVSDTMGVSHPPGAPFFILIMRIFSLLPLSSDIAVRCTYLAVLTGAFTTMLSYLIIVRLIRHLRGAESTSLDKIVIYGGAVIGALSLAWSYSMWFNSVEAILFTPSLFCTALCVWLALVWYEKADEPGSARYLLLIAFVIGLAIGVHLLSVLAIPAIVLIIYFRSRELAFGPFIGILAIALIATLLVYPGVVKYVPALANHYGLLAPLILILLIVYGFYRAVKSNYGLAAITLAAVLLILIGFSTYGYVYIRAGLDPNINENNPDNPARFFSYMNREQYGSRPIFPRYWNHDPEYSSAADFFWRYQINKMYLRYLWWQFIGRQGSPQQEFQDAGVTPTYSIVRFFTDNPSGLLRLLGVITCVPFILGLIGFGHQYVKDKSGWIIVLTLFFMTGLAIVLYLNQDDPQPRERDYSYVGSFFAFAVWIGIGASVLIAWIAAKFRAFPNRAITAFVSAFVLLLLSPVMLLAWNLPIDSRRGNYVAEDYSYNMLNSCPPHAVLITNGDNDTFPVWYMQEVEHVRPDVRIVNLSLVNTGWYIKQLKHHPPTVPISFSDAYIDRYLDMEDTEALLARYWPPSKQRIELNTPEGRMEWTMPATMYIPIRDQPATDEENNFLRVQDIMVLDIVRSDYDSTLISSPEPICFAVTVPTSNMIGLRDYLTMDGLVYRLNPRGDQPMDPKALARYLLHVYPTHMRGIADPHVHYDDNVDHLLSNYRAAYLQLAYYYMNRPGRIETAAASAPLEDRLAKFDSLSNSQKALALLQEMDRRVPERVRPINNPDLEIEIGRMYAELGDTLELRRRLDRIQSQKNLPLRTTAVIAAAWYTVLDDSSRASQILTGALSGNPTRDELYAAGSELLASRAFGPAELYLKRALALDPDDAQVVSALLQLYQATSDAPKMRGVLGQWVSRHPADTSARRSLDILRADSAGRVFSGVKG